MAGERHPVQWHGKVAVISLPAEIDMANADQVREDLLSVLNRCAALLVVDMSATTFCDSAGVHALVRAQRRATANRAGIRLVVTAPVVRRVLDITGVNGLIAIYPSVAAAIAEDSAPGQPDESLPASPGYTAACANPEDPAPQPG